MVFSESQSLCGLKTLWIGWEEGGEEVGLGVGEAAVLDEGFGEGDVDELTAGGVLAFHGLDVLVHAVVCAEPFAL